MVARPLESAWKWTVWKANNDFILARTWTYFPVELDIALQMARHRSIEFLSALFHANEL